jgi:LPPG:FO 2-phospho-L-lactate transferase
VQSSLQSANVIVVVNSNPVLSVLPIVAVPGVRDLLVASPVPRVAVSPVVGDHAVTGPAGDLLRLVGQPSSVLGVAGAYSGLIDGIVIDRSDQDLAGDIEALGIRVLCTDVMMRSVEDRERLARETLAFAETVR